MRHLKKRYPDTRWKLTRTDYGMCIVIPGIRGCECQCSLKKHAAPVFRVEAIRVTIWKGPSETLVSTLCRR